MGFDKYMMMHTQLYRIIQNSLTILKVPCAPPSHKSLVTTDLYCLQNFIFSGMSYSWNHTICRPLKWLPPLGHMNLRFLHICSGEGNGNPSVLLSGKSHVLRSLVGYSPWGREDSDMTERLHFQFSLPCIGEGYGNPLQYSFLENPWDRGAWWAAIYGVAQSWT